MTNDGRQKHPLCCVKFPSPPCRGFSSNLHFQQSAPTNGLTPSPRVHASVQGCGVDAGSWDAGSMRGQTYTLHFIASPFPFTSVQLRMRGQTYTLHFIAPPFPFTSVQLRIELLAIGGCGVDAGSDLHTSLYRITLPFHECSVANRVARESAGDRRGREKWPCARCLGK